MSSILGIALPLLFIIISSYIIWRSTDAFEVSADYLGRKMTKGVKGATINAIASSMPEFLTSLFFLFYIKDYGVFEDSFSGGLGVVAGSAVFNILIIPFAILVLAGRNSSKKTFSVDKKVIQRDGLFLIFSSILFIFIIAQEELSIIHGVILVLIYFVYFLLLRTGLGIGDTSPESAEAYFVPKVDLKLSHFVRLDLRQILFNGKSINAGIAWTSIIISTIVMCIGTWILVKGTELLGSDSYMLIGDYELKGLDLPLVFISVLLASAATSIPDTMISIRDARKGNHDDSITNALGSNIFDLSFALGVPLLIYTAMFGSIEMSEGVRILSVSYWLLMWIINLIAISIFIFSKRYTRITGYFLLFLYILFISYVVWETSDTKLFCKISETIITLVN